MSSAVSLHAGDRVLVTRLDYLGDIILSLPLVDAIRDRFPGVEVDYLARRPGAGLLAGDPRFARVFALEAGPAAAVDLVRKLRARRYAAVVDLYSNPRSAWLSRLTGAPARIGGDRRGRRRLYTHVVRVPATVRAATEHHLYYGEPLGIEPRAGALPRLKLEAREVEEAGERLDRVGVRGARPLLGVHPGGKWEVKRWPAHRFAELVTGAVERWRAEVVVFTGPDEREATARLRALVGEAAHYAPPMEIRELAAVIRRLDALVACDGGVMHLGVAVGTPTVGVFGSSEPEVWFPFESAGPFRAAFIPLECRPCHRHVCPLGHTRCLKDLSAEAVLDQLTRVLVRVGRSEARS